MSKKPAAGPNKPAAGPSESAAGPNESAAGPSESAADPNKPAAGPSESAADPNKPAAGPSESAAGPNKPAAGPSESAADPNKPAAGPNQPATSPTGPATSAVSGLAARLLAVMKTVFARVLPIVMSIYARVLPAAKSAYARVLPVVKTAYARALPVAKAAYARAAPIVDAILARLLVILKACLAWLIHRIFGDPKTEEGVEIVDAESVDPNAPLQQGEEPAEPETFREQINFLWRRCKREVYNFFVPQPVMVPAQLLTPEVDLEAEGQPTRLKGQMVYVMIIALFVILVSWAAFTEIDELVRAEGDIVPSESVQVVQSRLPGSVVEIHVDLGDRVNQGQILFEIEDEDVRANFDDNEIQRMTALAAIARLESESVGKESVEFPAGLENEAPVIVAQERAVFVSRRKALESEREVLQQEVESLRRGIKEREAEARQAKAQIGLIEQEKDVIKPLVDQGFEPKTALLNIEGRLADAVGREELSRLAADRMASDLETQQRRLDSLDNRFRAEAESQLVERRTHVAQTEARLDALREKVAFAEIKAPTDGIVTAVHVNTVGAVVDGGTVMAEVVPIDEEITVRARVNTDDVSKIFPGDNVYVSVSSYDVSRFGRLEGVVEKVAANSTQQENLPPYFVTMIKVSNPVFKETGIVAEIVPGTPVVVDMIAGKRTVLNYLLSPINRAQNIAFREK